MRRFRFFEPVFEKNGLNRLKFEETIGFLQRNFDRNVKIGKKSILFLSLKINI